MKKNLNKPIMILIMGLFLTSCNNGSGTSNTLNSVPTELASVDQQVITQSTSPVSLKQIKLSPPASIPIGSISTMIPLNDLGGLLLNWGNSLLSFNSYYNCGTRGNVVNMVEVDNDGDVVAVQDSGTYYAISGINPGSSPLCSNAINGTIQKYYPLATSRKGSIYYASTVGGINYIQKSPWNNLAQNITSWTLTSNDFAKFIDSDKYDDLLVVSAVNSSESGMNNLIYYTQYGDPNLHFYEYSQNPITAAKLAPINDANGNVIRIAFWAEESKLRYTNINSAVFLHNPEQAVHSINLPASDTGNITKIDVDTGSNHLILTTSTGNVYVEDYNFEQVPSSNADYRFNISDTTQYTTNNSSDPITALVKFAGDGFYIGTKGGNIYVHAPASFMSDKELSDPNNQTGLITNGCTNFLSNSGTLYRKCMFNSAGTYNVGTPFYSGLYLSTFGYGGGGGGGVSCTAHSGSNGGSGMKVSTISSIVSGVNSYFIQVGGGGGGNPHSYWGGGGGGGGYSAVCAGTNCDIFTNVLNIGGGGGGGGADCYDTSPNDGGADGGDSGSNANGNYNGMGGGNGIGGGSGLNWSDGGYGGYGGNGSSGVSGGFGGGGNSSGGNDNIGSGGGGGGYGGGGSGDGKKWTNPYKLFRNTGGGGGGGNYAKGTPNPNFQGSSNNGASATEYLHAGNNGGNGYELLIFSSSLQNIPGGPWIESCTPNSYDGVTLVASCQTGHNSSITNTVTVSPSGNCNNVNGKLEC